MRRVAAIMALVGLVAGLYSAPAAEAKKRKKKPKKPTKIERVAEGAYSAPAIGALGVGVCSPGTIGCVGFPTAPGELFVSVEITDTLGTPVFASVTQDTNGDNQADSSVDICGASTEPIPIEPGFEVLVFVWEGPGPSPVCAGTSSSGTIKMTFTNMP
jgi:hypothetical protein